MQNKGVNITYEEAFEILLQIPANKFIQGAYETVEGNCCAVGHLCKSLFNDAIPGRSINSIIDPYTRKSIAPSCSKLSIINDTAKLQPKYAVLKYLMRVIKDGKGDCLVFEY